MKSESASEDLRNALQMLQGMALCNPDEVHDSLPAIERRVRDALKKIEAA